LSEKIDILWSFVKNNLKSKIIIFFSTCKQVRFVYEVFRRMRPGITVLALHSKMKYMKRLSMCETFGRKQHAILFATDIVARGLDFPVVKWVIQADCPVDVKTYIHRSGRTARCDKDGESMLFLLPSEELEMVRLLKEKNISVEKKKIDQRKRASIQKKMASFCAADVSLKEFAQRAFVAYLKFVQMASNKKVFDVTSLDLDQFACSLGLAFPPTVKFITKHKEQRASNCGTTAAQGKKSMQSAVNDDNSDEETESNDSDASSDSESDDSADISGNPLHKKSAAGDKLKIDVDADDKDDDDLLLKKKPSLVADEDDLSDLEPVDPVRLHGDTYLSKSKKKDSKYAVAKKILKKQLKVNTKVVFDDEGLPVENKYRQLHTDISARLDNTADGGIDIDLARQQLQEQDKIDKQLYREKIQLKHRERRLKLKAEQRKKRQHDGADVEQDEVSDEPDLSFLPDPDKIYGPAADSDNSENGQCNSSSSDESLHNFSTRAVAVKRTLREDSSLHAKKRTKPLQKKATNNSDDGESDSDNMDTGLSLRDDEAIALKLLQ
jgi:ATP-dependent RNA helicase DDX10/DBP4